MRTSSFMLCFGLFCTETFAGQTELKYDIFAPDKRTHIPTKTDKTGVSVEKSEARIIITPKLSSVVSAGKNSIAVLDGVILNIDDISSGYRLLQVGDRSALFLHEGKQIRIHMNGSVESIPAVRQLKEKQ